MFNMPVVVKAPRRCWPAWKSVTPMRSTTPVRCCFAAARDSVLIDSVLIDTGFRQPIGGAAVGVPVLERSGASDAATCTSKPPVGSDRRGSIGSIPSHHQAGCGGGEFGADNGTENSEPVPNSEPDSAPGSEKEAGSSPRPTLELDVESHSSPKSNAPGSFPLLDHTNATGNETHGGGAH